MKEIKDTFLTIRLMSGLYPKMKEAIQSFQDLTGADYIEHNIVKNYYGRDFLISSFCNQNDWQELYWKEFWFNDPLERKVHKNILLNKTAMIPWSLVEDGCMTKRKEINEVEDGFSFGNLLSSATMESFSIGWKNKNDKMRMRRSLENENAELKKISMIHFEAFKDFQSETS